MAAPAAYEVRTVQQMRFMTLRTFLRGGYQQISEPTMVVKHGLPLFTVMPHGKAPALDKEVERSYTERTLRAE